MVMKKQESNSVWIPMNVGEELTGIVKGIDTQGEYGTQLVIETKEGDILKTPSHKALQTRIIKARIGQNIQIIFTGLAPAKKRGYNDTMLYDVFLDE